MNQLTVETDLTQVHARHHEPLREAVVLEYFCNECNTPSQLQADFAVPIPLQLGCVPFPQDNRFTCPHCGGVHNLTDVRKELELGGLESVKTPPLY